MTEPVPLPDIAALNGNKPTSTLKRPPVGSDVVETSGADLLATVWSPPESHPVLGCTGIIVRGQSHVLAGAPKSGKTTLLASVYGEWMACNLRVLAITEESLAMWRARLESLPGDWSGLQLAFGLGCEPGALLCRACSGDEDIIVVDTVRNLLQITEENDNSELARRINPWVAGVRNAGKTLILVHHSRKGGGDHGEGITGGHALLGAVDIAIELRRDDNASNRRTLTTLARVIEGRQLVYERLEGGTLRALGDPAQLARAEVQKRILASLDGPMSTADIRQSLDDPQPSLETIRQALTALANRGDILRDPPINEPGTGKRVRWLPVSKPTLQPTNSLRVAGQLEVGLGVTS